LRLLDRSKNIQSARKKMDARTINGYFISYQEKSKSIIKSMAKKDKKLLNKADNLIVCSLDDRG